MLRAIALSLALLIGIGTLIPLATEYAEAGSHKPRKYKKKKVKKYSKRWWRAYNKHRSVQQAKARRTKKARLARAKKARIKRARVAKIRRARLAKQRRAVASKKKTRSTARRSKRRTIKRGVVNVVAKQEKNVVKPTEIYSNVKAKTSAFPVPTFPSFLPSGSAAPTSWKSEGYKQGELQFRVTDTNGSPIGAASISVVGPAVEDAPLLSSRIKTVGGVTTTALRRTVIDQMIRENGWVVNDFQKEIGGKSVYVVVAQAPGANNQVENRMFYFTEVEGKIYSVATKSPDNGTTSIDEESEKVINSLQRNTTPPTQLASNRTVSNLVANEE